MRAKSTSVLIVGLQPRGSFTGGREEGRLRRRIEGRFHDLIQSNYEPDARKRHGQDDR